MELLGAGYKLWHMWALKFLPYERNDALRGIIQALRADETEGRLVQLANSERKFEYSSAGAVLRASAADYPEAAEAVRKIFFGELQLNPAGLGGTVSAARITVVVEDPREKEKEVAAHQGQARLYLFNVEECIDFDKGTITDLT